jgi:hypothetical protein
MVDPIPSELSPERLQQIQQLVDEIRQRQAVHAPPKPPQPRRRSRQYPGGRPNPWQSARHRKRRQG